MIPVVAASDAEEMPMKNPSDDGIVQRRNQRPLSRRHIHQPVLLLRRQRPGAHAPSTQGVTPKTSLKNPHSIILESAVAHASPVFAIRVVVHRRQRGAIDFSQKCGPSHGRAVQVAPFLLGILISKALAPSSIAISH